MSEASNSFNKIPETSFGNREQRTEDIGQDREQDGRQRTEDIGQRLRRDNRDRRTEQKGFAAVCPVGAGGFIYIYIYIYPYPFWLKPLWFGVERKPTFTRRAQGLARLTCVVVYT